MSDLFYIPGQEDTSGQEKSSSEISPTVRRISRLREKTQRLLRGYIDNLTIHGATKILTGSIPERIFWIVILLSVLVYFCYSANRLLVQFLGNEIIVSNEIVNVDKVKLPSVTVCDRKKF